jgi:UDP-GlcNAc3NAcA epimerase
MKTIHTVIGARPQFIKAATVSKVLKTQFFSSVITEKIIHTGQHYDANMSDIFFSELNMSKPTWTLNHGGGTHGEMTAKMLMDLERIFAQEKPDAVLVYGDTNSTLAGALAAAKLNIPIMHVEAGLRSFNTRMPEEINRVLTDKLSKRLYCPTQTSVSNLVKEGHQDGIVLAGDVMYDICLEMSALAKQKSTMFDHLNLSDNQYIFSTIHRAENTDDHTRLSSIASSLGEISEHTKVVFPVHPRTKQKIELLGLRKNLNKVVLTDPIGYIDLLALVSSAYAVVTDSGGLQKEAYFLKTPCITLRSETEWVETLGTGWNCLVEPHGSNLTSAVRSIAIPKEWEPLYGDGNAGTKIAQDIFETLTNAP